VFVYAAIMAVLLGWRVRQYLVKKKAAAQQIRARAAI
jgi:DMSO/TMAO reductase YedYZ heme-binding membrane subunit